MYIDYYDNQGGILAAPACPRDVVIPDTLGGNPVSTIGNNAFRLSRLTSVSLGDSVTTLGTLAFQGNQIAALALGNSVTSIGGDAFKSNQLTSVIIPNSVTTIGSGAFSNNQLASVIIEGSIASAGNNVFQTNPITSFIYSGITYTSSDPLTDDCYVFSPDTNTVTGFNFAGISTIQAHNNACLNQNLILPSSIGGVAVTTIGNYAFYANYLTSLTIPGSVTAIGNGAFGSNQLTSLALGNFVTTIGSGAFQYNQLTSVTIPGSVTSVGSQAFAGQLKLGGTTEEDCWDSYIDYFDPAVCQAFLDSVIYAQIYTSNPDPASIGLTNSIITEADEFYDDVNSNGNQTDIVSAQIINPAYISLVYQDKDGNSITPPSSTPTMITGNTAGVSSTNPTTNLTSYLVKDNPDPTNFTNFYKSGDTFN